MQKLQRYCGLSFSQLPHNNHTLRFQLVYWCPRRTFILPQKYYASVLHMLYNATWMLREKFGSRTLFHPISIISQFFPQDFGNLSFPKNTKSINNITGFHLVSCRVKPRPATMKVWEKEVFWKICAFGNLKCNASNNIISKILEKIPESSCIKSELVQED